MQAQLQALAPSAIKEVMKFLYKIQKLTFKALAGALGAPAGVFVLFFAILGSCLLANTALAASEMERQQSAVVTHESTPRRLVRVGYYTVPGFQEYNAKLDSYSGSGYEYLMALRQYANWDYEFVPCDFTGGVKMLEAGQLDLMNNVSITPARQATLAFSYYSSGANYGCLAVAPDNTSYAFNDYQALNGMKIAVIDRSIFRPHFKEFAQKHNISYQEVVYSTKEEIDQALLDGRVEGKLVTSSYQDGSRIVAKFAPMEYYFAVPKANTELLQELNTAMAQLRTDMPHFEENIEAKYRAPVAETVAVLSAAEKAYVKRGEKITVAVNEDWYPIIYRTKLGSFAGPLVDIYHRIEEVTGLKFELVPFVDYYKCLQSVKDGKCDMIIEFPYDFVFANKWQVSLSDLVNSVDIYRVTKDNKTREQIRSVGLYNATYLDSQIKRKAPKNIRYVAFNSMDEAVAAVNDGEIDCVYLNYYATTNYQNKGRFMSLSYVLVPTLRYDFGLGISDKANPLLKSIISKGLRTVGKEAIDAGFQSSAQLSHQQSWESLYYRNPLLFIFVCVLIAALLLYLYLRHKNLKELRAQNKLLEEANGAKDRFLSRMSHELRTPLNAIAGYTTELQQVVEEKGLAEGRIGEDLQAIQRASEYQLAIIDDLLNIQQMESGKVVLAKDEIDAAQYMQNIIRMVKPEADRKHISFTYERKTAFSETYLLDGVRFQQIILNVLLNAIKFTPEGGSVHLEAEALEKTEKEIIGRFTITDTGIGMSKEFVENHLFEKFAQEHGDNKSPYAGCGIGLATSRDLLHLMGGEITCESQPGKGSTFIITMRAEYLKKRRRRKSQRPPLPTDLTGLKILLCEDNPMNRDIEKSLLTKLGCLVETADDGKQALEAFRASEVGYYDLVLMDIRMPVMDGLEATVAIRDLQRRDAKEVPIFAVSANAFEEDVQKSLAAGMNEHIPKPLDLYKIYDKIKQYCVI